MLSWQQAGPGGLRSQMRWKMKFNTHLPLSNSSRNNCCFSQILLFTFFFCHPVLSESPGCAAKELRVAHEPQVPDPCFSEYWFKPQSLMGWLICRVMPHAAHALKWATTVNSADFCRQSAPTQRALMWAAATQHILPSELPRASIARHVSLRYLPILPIPAVHRQWCNGELNIWVK